MNKFEVKAHTYMDDENPLKIYVIIQTSKVNPLELEVEIDDFIKYMRDKYKIKRYKKTWTDWIKEKLNI